MLVWILGAIAVFVVAGVAAVRLAPSDPQVWHVDPRGAADPGMSGVLLRHPVTGAEALARFDAAMTAEPRVKRLAGSVAEGRITYIARTKWVGFPDYLTVNRDGDALVILSRQRFGQSDLGVNRDRLARVLERFEAVE